jgi:uncharacterized protein YndB with AHSA1/START domain
MTAEMRTFIDIDATPERVWQVLTDLRTYPEWMPFGSSAEGALTVGGRLSFTVPLWSGLMRRTVQLTVLEVEPPRRLRFRGRAARWGLPGLLAVERTFTIASRDGGVRLWQQTFFRGVLVPVITPWANGQRLPAGRAMEALRDQAEGTGNARRA